MPKSRVAQTTPQLFETYKTLKYFMTSLDELTDLDIDHRVLNLFRVTINKEYQSFQNISEMEFHKFWNQSFKPTETND
jgi:ureidoglycolate hydrolase